MGNSTTRVGRTVTSVHDMVDLMAGVYKLYSKNGAVVKHQNICG